MHFRPKRRNRKTGGPSPWDTDAILTYAKALHHLEDKGRLSSLLQGRHIALLTGCDDTPDASLFENSATALGAQVAHVRTGLWADCQPEEIRQLAGVLGRLYVALACQGMSASLVQRIADAVPIPVLDRITDPGHPTAGLADLLDIDATRSDKCRLVMQAALLVKLA